MAKKILVAEDEETLSYALKNVIKDLKHECVVTKDGEEALKALGESTFDLVLLDIILPKVNGLEVLKKMRETGDKTPAVVLTNLNDQDSINAATSLGAMYYIIKSDSSLESISSIIQKALAS
jgi:CheY-like chemotaxis protein